MVLAAVSPCLEFLNVNGVDLAFLCRGNPNATELVVVDEFSLRGVFSIQGVARVFPNLHRPRREARGVKQEQPATQRVAHACDDLDDLEGLQ